MKIGIVGLGMVGSTLGYGFSRLGHEVIPHDIKIKDSQLKNLLQTDMIFVCVPTPQKANGECDTSIVKQVVRDLKDMEYPKLVIIKSTIPPGTTDRLQDTVSPMNLAFCPEFLREKSRFSDFVENHDVCVIGSETERHFKLIKEAHGEFPKQFIWLKPKEAEYVKYFCNCLNAVRITFANEFALVCEADGVDYAKVKKAAAMRSGIGDHYLDSNKNFRAFGGNCLPKDTSAFAFFAKQAGVPMRLLDAAIAINEVLSK